MTEAACLGAAMPAGVVDGVHPDRATAVGRTVRMGREITPDSQSARAYDGGFEIYGNIYPVLKDLQRHL